MQMHGSQDAGVRPIVSLWTSLFHLSHNTSVKTAYPVRSSGRRKAHSQSESCDLNENPPLPPPDARNGSTILQSTSWPLYRLVLPFKRDILYKESRYLCGRQFVLLPTLCSVNSNMFPSRSACGSLYVSEQRRKRSEGKNNLFSLYIVSRWGFFSFLFL